MAPETEAI